jgi:hypothetical protein
MLLFDITQIIIPSDPISAAQLSKVQKKSETEPMFEGWWPSWAKEGAFENREKVSAANGIVAVKKWDGDERSFTVQTLEATNARVSTFYYPYWKATVNDEPVEVRMDQNGAIVIPVQGGLSSVALRFEEPPVKTWAGVVSLTIWLLFLFVGLMKLSTGLLSVSDRMSVFEGEYS